MVEEYSTTIYRSQNFVSSNTREQGTNCCCASIERREFTIEGNWTVEAKLTNSTKEDGKSRDTSCTNFEGMDVNVGTGVRASRRWWSPRFGTPTNASWSNSDTLLSIERSTNTILPPFNPCSTSVLSRLQPWQRINPIFHVNELTRAARPFSAFWFSSVSIRFTRYCLDSGFIHSRDGRKYSSRLRLVQNEIHLKWSVSKVIVFSRFAQIFIFLLYL